MPPPSAYVEIAINLPQIEGLFHYHLPPDLVGKVCPGCLVVVPFGAQKVQGVVLREIDEPQVPATRAVIEQVDPLPVLTPAQLQLAQWMADYTLAPLASCIGRMLPPGLGQHTDTLYTLAAGQEKGASGEKDGGLQGGLQGMQKRLVDLLVKRGPLRGQQIERSFNQIQWRGAAQSLVRAGLLRAQTILPPPRVRPKLVRTVQLACAPEIAEAALPRLGRAGSAALQRRQAILRLLIQEPWAVNAAWVYAHTGGTLADLQELGELGLITLGEVEVWRDPVAAYAGTSPPERAPRLTPDQVQAWQAVQDGLEEIASGKPARPYLLHGVTGSGKTEIYLQAVARTIRMGKQAIVLVPEIALTPQTVRRFVSRFPGQVGLVHSRLSDGERYDTWRRARLGLLPVIIGPRSALFTPLPDLGLIVVDEFHDDSFYQDESAPFYHAATASVMYARLANAVCVLGSATPDVVSLYRAEHGSWRKISLPMRILAHREAVERQAEQLGLVVPPLRIEMPASPVPGEPVPDKPVPGEPAPAGSSGAAPGFEASLQGPLPGTLPEPAQPSQALPMQALPMQAASLPLPAVRVVDMRQELKAGNRSIFSRPLQEELCRVVDAGLQAILFLNRRGTATFVFCRSCGTSLRCPRCDIPLTYHSSQDALFCHYCGYRRSNPKTCPSCGSTTMRQYGTGTERVEKEVQELLPQARTLRWDAETTRQKGAHELILAHFAAHRADVLIGTQMLAKGLDLPLVTLVGVVLADVGLNLPDYRANERTFQVLTQVAGRAGRSLLGGQVILQTFQPDHYTIQAAAGHDYAAFASRELAYRRQLRYPPFYRLVRLEYRHRQPGRAEEEANIMGDRVRDWLARQDRRATEMIGPVPCFFAQLHGFHRWQIILRGPDPASLLRGRSLGDWRIEVDPPSLL
jgi:primosomal protein N' (replication factor Y)